MPFGCFNAYLHIRIFVLVVFWVWEILGVLSESERAV
jgi:hypothetical protein